MILDIDIGNTRLKWRLSQGSRVVSHGAENGLLQVMLRNTVAQINKIEVSRVRLVHVLGSEREKEIVIFFKNALNLSVEVARSTDACGVIINQYKPPQQLGADRWLGMVSAYHHVKKSCCVVDCGSAITIDFVLQNGTYVGGYIAPGLKLLVRALVENTQQLPLVNMFNQASLSFGQTTNMAISNGVLSMAVGFVEKNINVFLEREPESVIFFTGGDAELLAKELAKIGHVTVKCEPDLVLNGLSLVLP